MNENHDAHGLFASGGGSQSGKGKTKTTAGGKTEHTPHANSAYRPMTTAERSAMDAKAPSFNEAMARAGAPQHHGMK